MKVNLFEPIPPEKVNVVVRLGTNSPPHHDMHPGYIGTWVNDKTWGNGWKEHTYYSIGLQLVEYISDDGSELGENSE